MLTTNLETNKQLIKYQNFSHSQTEKLAKLEEVLAILGLQLSDSELNRLQDKKLVSLEGLTLADLGTVLILASAISSQKFKQQNISFRDLLIFNGTSNTIGIPLYCWENKNSATKTYLRLTFFTGNPAIVIQNQDD